MAAPESETAADEAAKIENPPPESDAAVPPPRPGPKRRGSGALSKLVISTLALLVGIGAAGYAALTFRDLDPRVSLAADYVEKGLAEARGSLDKAQSLIADLTGSTKPAPKAPSRHALLEKAPLAPPPAPEVRPAPQSDEVAPQPGAATPAVPAPVESAKKPVEAPAPEAKRDETPEASPKPAQIAQEPAPAPAPPPAPVTAEPPKPVPLPKVETPDADGFTDRDLISALEGRIEALNDEVQALRQKLDAPKSEGRAAPDTEVARTEEAAKPAPAPLSAPAAPDATSARVVVAFALQRELEAGKPYADEIAALSRLDAEPAPILVELADKGAPTGEQLRESLQEIAKKLEAHEDHAEQSHGVTEQLLESASKLVKVRPSGRPHPESVAGKIERIESALGHNDFAAAESLFESLPKEAKAEAREFGETLHRRSEAGRAADDLLRGAIAALGKK
jgi:hypothetical protein